MSLLLGILFIPRYHEALHSKPSGNGGLQQNGYSECSHPELLVDYYTKGSYPTERAGSLTEDQQTNKLKSLMSPVSPSHLPALTLRQTSHHNNLCSSLCLREKKDNQPSWGITHGRMGIWVLEPRSSTILWLHEQSQRWHASAIFFLHWGWVTQTIAQNQLTFEREKHSSIHSLTKQKHFGEIYWRDDIVWKPDYVQLVQSLPYLNITELFGSSFCVFYIWYWELKYPKD